MGMFSVPPAKRKHTHTFPRLYYTLSHTGFVYTKWIVMFCLFKKCHKSIYLNVYCDMQGANVAVGQHYIYCDIKIIKAKPDKNISGHISSK